MVRTFPAESRDTGRGRESSKCRKVVAVAGRQKQSADRFAEKYGIPAAYGSYQELAKDPDVEIVYIGTILPCHFSACMMFLDNDKHVLCEKPITVTVQECKDLAAKAKDKKLFFMEGFWTRFFPAVQKMQEVLKEGGLGQINFLRANFCLPVTSGARLTKKELGGGGLMDLGCYLVQFANLVFSEPPQSTTVVGQLNEDGVDKCGTLLLKYTGGSMAVLMYSIDSANGHNSLTLYGSKGNLQLEEPFHCPTKITLPSEEMQEFPLPDSPYTFNFVNSQGFIYEACCVRDCLKKGLLECPRMPHADSISIMTILEEAQRQLGINYTFQS
ncbi:trans-1,2-dihydrobenzene-1,2-diol dehydrogenase-like isoform X2 [Babylonia areolata]|uniref:trans-1,2-dihydrobenzene-1,2-diol dehydrogenase-like isoform X2 n=1 Tax=Babylonia areolata TaxID=304850 RepID=UPI003FD14685